MVALLGVGAFSGVEVKDGNLTGTAEVVSEEERSRKSEKRPEPLDDTEVFELLSDFCGISKFDLEDELRWERLLERLGSTSRVLEWLLLPR